ncbi:MAG: DNA cytosine methyltransferase [Deltaproteobacteria bacterium]|jgi:DNA (cytosine-5)-methyltransferase 1|nr:DNA cytosine methyltransferase [Deltaproteobacteria bacterium]
MPDTLLRYLSVCSGIEAASVAWGALGWRATAFAEIESFPCAVLKHRYPGVPNLGDLRAINGADFCGKIDVLVGGTPCQSFSVAGLRRGLEDERGNLALEFVRIANESKPAFIVWENVLGALSDRGNAFGCFLGALAGEDAPLEPAGGKWTDAGYVLGPERRIAWRVFDAQYFGLAQRRRRVFLVACPGDGADPRAILFESGGLRRDTPPRRQARTDVAGTLEGSLGERGSYGSPDTAAGGYLQVAGPLKNGSGVRGWAINAEEAASGHLQAVPPVSCKWSKGTGGPAGDEHQNLVVTPINTQVALRHAALGERTGLGIGDADSPGFTLQAGHCHAVAITPPLTGNQYGDHESREGLLQVLAHSAVRRLTPRECERLQGFPDDFTLIPYRGKPAADGPRYRALGNAIAVPVIRWIGARIAWHVALHGNGLCPTWCPCASANIPLQYNSEACLKTRMRHAPEYAPVGATP